jgi:allantoinase
MIGGDGRETSGAICVEGGRIAAINPVDAQVGGGRELEFGGDVILLPGLVDTHVHISEPGTDFEGFDTATRAAAAGGITTLVDMPLDSIPSTVNLAALDAKREAATGTCHVDVGFWGGAIPGNLSDLPKLHEAGVLGFKCFMVDSGSPHFPNVDAEQMEAALEVIQGFGTPLLVHAESNDVIAPIQPRHSRRYVDWLEARPRGAENLAVAQVIEAARRTRGRAHIVHVSSSDALPMILSARRDRVSVTAETCPHYLVFSAEGIGDGATVFKCAPPVREEANREQLWTGLMDGVLALVVSDHSPCTIAMKALDSGDFAEAWAGISSLQLGLPAVWTEGRRRGVTLGDIARWMSDGPARLAGLERKGQIAEGFDADICVFAPDESFVVDPRKLHHRNPVTAYSGLTLTGVVRGTILRGQLIDGRHPGGRLLARGAD